MKTMRENAARAINYRLCILANWLAGSRFNVSVLELTKYLLKHGFESKARSMVRSVGEETDYYVIRLKDIEVPLYYPRGLQLLDFYQVIVEQCFPDSWHKYSCDHTLVEDGDIVADCGAGEGLFALINIAKCKRLYAIEPHPSFVDALSKTFGGHENIEILPFALSDRLGDAFLSDAGLTSSLGVSIEGIPVKVTTIDTLFYERSVPCTYIKGDLEGFDYLMLKGAENTIRENLPKIAVTTYHATNHAELISRYLKKICPEYNILEKGVTNVFRKPIMLHAWVD
ncbi:MAG: FkbM family methyltransferase [Candidatus Omnitrophota bacterium]|jgi:FkbM family methyltransferase|nr:MAG: FkbM family methyltransferase [Candidatus Omnitrophota bacterium]